MQRMSIRYCVDETEKSIDAKSSGILNAKCIACNEKVFRSSSDQLFHHISSQCENIVLSELSHRLANIIAVNKTINLPVDFLSEQYIKLSVKTAEALVVSCPRPLIKITSFNNEIFYLTIKLSDTSISNYQLNQLKQCYESVIELDLSNISIPPSNLSHYLSSTVLTANIYQNCTWLSFNPLQSISRHIADIQSNSISELRQKELNELAGVKKDRDYILQSLEDAKAQYEHYLTLSDCIEITTDINTLKRQRDDLQAQVNELNKNRVSLSKHPIAVQLNSEIAKLRNDISELQNTKNIKAHEISELEEKSSSLNSTCESMNQKISDAEWLKTLLVECGCTFGEIHQQIEVLFEILDSRDEIAASIGVQERELNDLNAKIKKKKSELELEKKNFEYYKKQNFMLFRENNKSGGVNG